MIKLQSAGTAPDYTEHGSVSTDCKTVGEFMTQAAAIFGGNVTIIVDGCRYEFHDTPKITVTDDTPLAGVAVEQSDSLLSAVTVLRVTSKPKPKTVKKSGWVNIYRAADDRSKRVVGIIYETKAEAIKLPKSASRIAVAKIEWEEVER